MRSDTARQRFTVTGVVQGVGFRPFVHRIATELRLTGFVGNDSGAVFVEVQGRGKVWPNSGADCVPMRRR
ncbi:acylphosphatase family protein [Mycobacterium xenopi 3993]|nr:acylphosphatase family protein [Mycobacterium xenopi 3993]